MKARHIKRNLYTYLSRTVSIAIRIELDPADPALLAELRRTALNESHLLHAFKLEARRALA